MKNKITYFATAMALTAGLAFQPARAKSGVAELAKADQRALRSHVVPRD